MQTQKETDVEFLGTHKGHFIQIDREPEGDVLEGRYYIIVTSPSGMLAYDGWAPDGITTMDQAKHEALRGACIQ